MSTTIVQADAEHLDLVVPLFDAYRVWYGKPSDPDAARAFLGDRLRKAESTILLALDAASSATLAFAQLYPSFSSISVGRVWILNDLFVAEAHRRRGLGRLLLRAVHDYARDSGAIRVVLETAVDNAAAKALYEQEGYRRDVRFDHYELSLT